MQVIRVQPRALIHKPLPLNRVYNGDSNIKAPRGLLIMALHEGFQGWG